MHACGLQARGLHACGLHACGMQACNLGERGLQVRDLQVCGMQACHFQARGLQAGTSSVPVAYAAQAANGLPKQGWKQRGSKASSVLPESISEYPFGKNEQCTKERRMSDCLIHLYHIR